MPSLQGTRYTCAPHTTWRSVPGGVRRCSSWPRTGRTGAGSAPSGASAADQEPLASTTCGAVRSPCVLRTITPWPPASSPVTARPSTKVAPAARAAEAAAAVNAGTFTMACEGIRSAPTAWALSDGSMTRARGPSIHSEATPRSASMVADCVSRSTSASPTAISSVPGCRNSTARPARWVTRARKSSYSPRDRRPSVRRPSEWWPSIHGARMPADACDAPAPGCRMSATSTRRPSAASSKAMLAPTTPAPTTMTSADRALTIRNVCRPRRMPPARRTSVRTKRSRRVRCAAPPGPTWPARRRATAGCR